MPGRKKGPPKAAPKSSRSSRKSPEASNPNVNPAEPGSHGPGAGPPFPIVAVGASAGGIEAFTQLLQALPTDTGMALVLVQHLSPTHVSISPRSWAAPRGTRCRR